MTWEFIDRLGRLSMSATGFRSATLGSLHAYVYEGKGPLAPVVLLHGIGGSGTAWALTAGALRKEASLIRIPDLPGHGFSPPVVPMAVTGIVEAVDRALDLRATSKTLVVGHSLGAVVAVRMALKRPEALRGLLLVTPAGATSAPGALDQVKGYLAPRSDAEASALLDRMLVSPAWYSALAGPYLRETYTRGAIQEAIQRASPEDMLTADELGRLAMPVRLLWGRLDRLLPRSDLDYYRASLPPHAEIIEEDFGHAPVLDRPTVLARHILEMARV